MNISSVVVHPRPGSWEKVKARLARESGVEVHGVSPEGKLIVSIETDSEGSMVETFDRIKELDDVLSVAMVFQQQEDEPELEI